VNRTAPLPQARKRFGQHFLHDRAVIERIIDAVRPQADDCVVEIGGGPGALTLPLLARLNRLHVVELDRDLVPVLRAACPDTERLIIHQADALNFDFAALAHPGMPLRLVGNLPYNIATPLLFRLFGYAAILRDMTFMVQLEVAQRLAAQPGSAHYGRLSVTSFVHARTELLFNVSPGAFRPPPRVVSAVIRIVPRPAPFAVPKQFDAVVLAAFAQRRKTLRNALRAGLTAADFERTGIEAGRRAEELAAADFARLAEFWRAPDGG
jgi:16S rRNA (adenine1518-N6/adenine1519-N6)-dimethyltransferase